MTRPLPDIRLDIKEIIYCQSRTPLIPEIIIFSNEYTPEQWNIGEQLKAVDALVCLYQLIDLNHSTEEHLEIEVFNFHPDRPRFIATVTPVDRSANANYCFFTYLKILEDLLRSGNISTI